MVCDMIKKKGLSSQISNARLGTFPCLAHFFIRRKMKMKRLLGLMLTFFMLFSLFSCQWLMPDDETPDTNELQLSAKERFINQIKQDFKTGNKATKLIAKPFIQSVVFSSCRVEPSVCYQQRSTSP